MAEITAEQLAQRIFECRLLETGEIERALADAGGRGMCSFEEFVSVLLRKELLTNWQLDRLVQGLVRGYFYGNWKVLYIVGYGTFARVYRAINRETGESKAVKVLRSRYSNDEDTRERFTREARMVMKLRHPNIVPIHEVDVERGRSYMVMDFVEGQNLREYVKAHQKLDLNIAMKILRDLAAGLAYGADRGITHRDMKLSNVLLSATGIARLVDFGLATVSNDFADDPDDLFNPRSIDYAGLEKVTNAPKNDPRSDIFFLGSMFYHMITGQPAMEETRERIKRLSPTRYREIKPLTLHDGSLPHRVVILCTRLMDLRPDKRIQTPTQALKETESVIAALARGDVGAFDQEKADQMNEEYEKLVSKETEGEGKTVMVVESKPKVQDSLRERLKNLGYRVLIVGDPNRALERFEDLDPAEDLPADCLIFGCAGTGVEGIKAFVKFSTFESAVNVPSILMVTENLQKHLAKIEFGEMRAHLGLPVKWRNLRNKLRELLNIQVDDASGDE